MESKNIIDNTVQYPVDAQSNGFICAFVSALLAVDKVDVNTPVYCGQKRSVCINCGNCGDKPMMARHHSSRYHHYLTVTGIGLLWDDSEISMTGVLDFAMKAAGYSYAILDKEICKTEMFDQIKKSVDNGCPVIMKLGNGADRHVVTGYDTYNMTLYGIDAHKHWAIKLSVLPDGYTKEELFYTDKWYDTLSYSVIITGKIEKLPLPDLLNHMIFMLSANGGTDLEAKVMDAIDSDGGDKQETAKWLNNLAGYTVECRWHGAECFTAEMYHMTDNTVCRELFCEMTDMYLLFHDLCWKIWGLLGVGPETNYVIAADAGERLKGEAAKAEMKQLFAKLFEIDRNVLDMMNKCAAAFTQEVKSK